MRYSVFNQNLCAMKFLVFLAFLTFSGCVKGQSSFVQAYSKSVSAAFLPAETGNFRADMLNMVNALRAEGCKCGGKKMAPVPALKWNSLLENTAINHAKDMAQHNRLDHVGSDGSEIDTRANRVGYKWMELGENIAFGQPTTRQVMLDWIKSATHCKQMMSDKITEIGAARSGKYWVQDYGKQRTW